MQCSFHAADLGNPYSRGWAQNWREVFCTPIPPRWGQLGLEQRSEAAAQAAAVAAEAEAGLAPTAPPAGGAVQMVPLPPPKHNGSSYGAAAAANGEQGGGVEVLPYAGEEVGGCRRAGWACAAREQQTRRLPGFGMPPPWLLLVFQQQTPRTPCPIRPSRHRRGRRAATRGTWGRRPPRAPTTLG